MKRKTVSRFGALLLAVIMCVPMTAFGAEQKIGFNDVKESDYFYPAVQWGIEEGVTNGMSENTFGPSSTTTRAQAVTFMWRMAGKPAAGNAKTFSDVEAGSWYETAVNWAVGQGITKGTGENTFSPNMPLDKAMCLTMLYRMQGSGLDAADNSERTELGSDSTMEDLGKGLVQGIIDAMRSPEVKTDVEQGSYYELAVYWGLISNIITEDTADVSEGSLMFKPNDPCLRSQMISFLYQTKLLGDAEEAAGSMLVENDPVFFRIPKEYMDVVHFTWSGIGEDEEGTLIKISERASREAAEAMGEDPDETGAGELFSISRVTADTLNGMLSGEMAGQEVFAKDGNGFYYIISYPTDVRIVRESNEITDADMEQWEKLNEWARNEALSNVFENSKELMPVE